jgi:L-alanine-DL-glutamate epimerase-like enolase superfamily enzyme
MAGSPVSALASVHAAAVTENFLALENHSADIAGWSALVDGLPNPLVQDGYIAVPETPGLGFTDFNVEACRDFLHPDESSTFESTEFWTRERSHDRLWS